MITQNMHVKEILKRVTDILVRDDNIIFAYLYGSLAKGKYHKFSDIDIGVYLRDPTPEKYSNIYLLFPENLGRNVDITLLNDAPPLLRYDIIKHGILLFSKDEKDRKNFVFHTLVEALDIKEALERCRKRRLERFLNAG